MSKWGVLPKHVGIVGFSAGAMVASGTLLQVDPAMRSNFAAPIYGEPFGAMPEISENPPPIFWAWAQDDALAVAAEAKVYEALRAAGKDPDRVVKKKNMKWGLERSG